MSPSRFQRELLYVPNLLSLFRMLIIPFVLVYIDNESPLRSLIACVLYGISAATDFFDGYLARRYGWTSVLGKFLDPLADKILVMATLVWMVPMGRVEAWVVILLLTREIGITALRGVASAEGLIIAARPLAKEKTAFQLVGILCLIGHFRYPVLFTPYEIDFHQVGIHTIYISLVLSLLSAVEYLQLFAKEMARRHA